MLRYLRRGEQVTHNGVLGAVYIVEGEREMEINTIEDLHRAIEAGPYTVPGMYPTYFVMFDGEALSFSAAQENLDQIEFEIKHDLKGCWRVFAYEVNYENDDLLCAHTGLKIPAAYSESDD